MLIAEKLRRLTEMDAKEIRFRIAQSLRVHREQLQLALDGKQFRDSAWWRHWDARNISDSDLRAAILKNDGRTAAVLLPEYFACRKAPAFYWTHCERDSIVTTLKRCFPGRAERLVQDAEALCAHRFSIFAYPEISCGAQIPWRRDLVHGVESQLGHYSRQAPLSMEKTGDSKIVWELNRHQHFFTLGAAYLLTGNEKYAEECLAQWEDWSHKNPYLQGINWASSLEVAFRAWSWSWTLFLLLGSRALTGERIGKITQALSRSASFIAENLSTYFSPNTHLLGEGFALFVVGTLFPELKGAEEWRELGKNILIEEMQKQVREDGSHFEQSIFYHRYAVEFFLCASILAGRNFSSFPSDFRDRLEKMLEFLIYTGWPAGSHPSVGDSDGGRLIPFGLFDAQDQRPVLATGAVYFGRNDFRKIAGSMDEQCLWLLGSDSERGFARLGDAQPKFLSRTFADAGVVIMRSDWSPMANFLMFDAGPQGMGPSAHGHADSLGILCAANGVNWLVDPGTFVYTSSQAWRDYFRSTPAHNTIAIDGLDQAERVDWFKWRKSPVVSLEKSLSIPALDYAVGSHTGYARLPQAVLHRRHVIFLKPDAWVLSDELTGKGKHRVSVFFHFAPGISVTRAESGWLARKDGEKLFLVPLAPGMDFRIASGEENPMQGWYSSDYGHREPACVLVGEMEASTPLQLNWLLYPAKAGEDAPSLREETDDGSVVSVTRDGRMDWIVWGQKTAQPSGAALSTNGSMATLRMDASGSVQRIILCGGSFLNWQGRPMLTAAAAFDQFIAEWRDGVLEIEASPAQSFRLESPPVGVVKINGKPGGKFDANGAVVFRGDF